MQTVESFRLTRETTSRTRCIFSLFTTMSGVVQSSSRSPFRLLISEVSLRFSRAFSMCKKRSRESKGLVR